MNSTSSVLLILLLAQCLAFILVDRARNRKYAQITKADWKAVKERAILMQSDVTFDGKGKPLPIDGFFTMDELIKLKKLTNAVSIGFPPPPMPSQREGGEHA